MSLHIHSSEWPVRACRSFMHNVSLAPDCLSIESCLDRLKITPREGFLPQSPEPRKLEVTRH
jgi:hypothetical protein